MLGRSQVECPAAAECLRAHFDLNPISSLWASVPPVTRATYNAELLAIQAYSACKIGLKTKQNIIRSSEESLSEKCDWGITQCRSLIRIYLKMGNVGYLPGVKWCSWGLQCTLVLVANLKIQITGKGNLLLRKPKQIHFKCLSQMRGHKCTCSAVVKYQ